MPTRFQRFLKFFLIAISLPLASPGSSAALPSTIPPSAQRVVLTNVMLIGDAASAAQLRNLVVEKGMIAAIHTSRPEIRPGDRVVDGAGRFASPGLIDMHVHVFDPSDLLMLLSHGITTARQMSGERKLLHFRNQVASGKLAGPQLVVASPVLNQKSRYASGSAHRFVTGPQPARQLVARYHAMGYDLIKVYDGLAPDTWAAIIDESEQRGMPVAGHPPFSLTMPEVLEASLQSVEHAEMLYQAPLGHSKDPARLAGLLEHIGGHAFYLTPTLVVWDDLAHLAHEHATFERAFRRDVVNPALMQHLETTVERISKVKESAEWLDKSSYLALIARKVHEHGGKLLIGSDSGFLTNSGVGTIKEMALLRRAGIAPAAIMGFATKNGAAALGMDKLGTLDVGMQADLVLTRHDPREQLDTYHAIEGVMADGVYHDAAAVIAMKQAATRHMSWFRTLRWQLIEQFDQWRDSL